MYSRLTKLITIDDDAGNKIEAVACVNYGTERCQIHNGASGCVGCSMLSAILNQLYNLEEAILSPASEEQSE